jgi:hypothetical protein
MQKICFFYKPEVPDFGKEFTYIKLGKKENIQNAKRHNVIFEADLRENLSKYNEYLMDYSGLYALYENNLIKEKHMLVIHYDTDILDNKWMQIIEKSVKSGSVVFYDYSIDKDAGTEIAKWVYNKIDDIFILAHNKTYLSILKKEKITKLPMSSQFACSRDTFLKLMKFLLPIYEVIMRQPDISFKYAHLLERSWSIFFAKEGYIVKPVIEDQHLCSESYGKTEMLPLLSLALSKNVKKFSEILINKPA